MHGKGMWHNCTTPFGDLNLSTNLVSCIIVGLSSSMHGMWARPMLGEATVVLVLLVGLRSTWCTPTNHTVMTARLSGTDVGGMRCLMRSIFCQQYGAVKRVSYDARDFVFIVNRHQYKTVSNLALLESTGFGCGLLTGRN